jgi:methyl-accepting chemotaxis protein
MGEIASASDEQSKGIEQVSLAVSQMDSVTQQNASLVQESAAASAALEAGGTTASGRRGLPRQWSQRAVAKQTR